MKTMGVAAWGEGTLAPSPIVLFFDLDSAFARL